MSANLATTLDVDLLLHDGSAGAALVAAREVWPQAREAHSLTLEADLLGCHSVLVVADVQRLSALLALQAKARSLGVDLLLLTVEPGCASLGPWLPAVADARHGCLGCHALWVGNNLRQASHWTAQLRQPQTDIPREALEPLGPAAQALLRHALQAARSAPETLRGEVQRLHFAAPHTSRHRFWHHPACAHCQPLPQDSASNARLSFAARPLAAPGDTRVPNPRLHSQALRAAFLDPRTGLIRHAFHDITSDLMPMCAAEMPILGYPDDTEVGYGRAETRLRSEQVAMLEVLERFCGHEPRRVARSVHGSYEQVSRQFPGQVVNPEDFVLHEAWQLDAPGFQMEPYSPALAFDWSWGHSMKRGAPVLVPSQLVYYWQTGTAERPENRFVHDTSSGCAMGGCLEEAVLYGLFEALERDAYLSAWYGRIAPRRIQLDAVRDERVQSLVARARAQGYELHAFDMRLDVDVPMVWALIVDPDTQAPVKSYCASAAHFRWEQALFSALVEITTSIGVYRRTMPARRERARQLAADASQVQRMSDHVLLYSLPETFERLSFVFEGGAAPSPLPQPPAPLDLRDEMERRVAQTLQVARDVIVVDLTWAPMRELGLHAVKVLTPGLTPVTFGHQYRRVDLARVNRARAARGLTALAADQLNPEPHNFP